MSEPRFKKDCDNCGEQDVPLAPGVGGELYGECRNCEQSFTDYDRGYMVFDGDDQSVEARDAAIENDRRGFLW